jgi:hypothetical protein
MLLEEPEMARPKSKRISDIHSEENDKLRGEATFENSQAPLEKKGSALRKTRIQRSDDDEDSLGRVADIGMKGPRPNITWTVIPSGNRSHDRESNGSKWKAMICIVKCS